MAAGFRGRIKRIQRRLWDLLPSCGTMSTIDPELTAYISKVFVFRDDSQ
jgi:hypothetical protein